MCTNLNAEPVERENFYYNPQSWGWQYIGSVDYLAGTGDYEWNEAVVYRRKEDGQLGWAIDAGCSCNCMSETLRTESDLTLGTREQLQAALEEGLPTYYSERVSSVEGEIADIMLAVVSG
jgi:hypothetical protein